MCFLCSKARNVSNNGLLVDPHDQKAIEDALLKLVADKNLWTECRKHGLKNIHSFSWPEHCRNYLSHLEHCRNRHPTIPHKIIPTNEEPMSESLRDVEDLSLRFSTDGDFKANGDVDPATRQKELTETFTKMSTSNRKSNTSYSPGRRQKLYIIAIDAYDTNGDPTGTSPIIIKNVMETAVANPGEMGFILLTGLSLQETKELLKKFEVNLDKFDALTRRVDDLRQRLRMRSFRCNTVFTHAANKLNVISLFASRAQALRYLSIRWGMDLSKMFAFVGEKGDTDYEDLFAGLHKTVVLKDSVEYGSEKLLRSKESFKKEDMVPTENSNIVVSKGYEVHDISAALKTLGIN
ncbi:hypothetical protein L1987_08907 [Smallanthus sonchifolius]|uniref:Uncharacterized protein n=1 Tax=Smallanthus sonchifolius TaxID=185202 RepID=A0ACB9JNP8_9ASTR|nr:hypothetical protein L1987_08907 [Smallanthus sonchifolius]